MQERPIYFYMANLWSEVEKIFIYKEKGENELMQSALTRAVSIINKIKSFDNKSATFEINILENIITDLVGDQNKNSVFRSQLSSYLNPFALRVMRR